MDHRASRQEPPGGFNEVDIDTLDPDALLPVGSGTGVLSNSFNEDTLFMVASLGTSVPAAQIRVRALQNDPAFGDANDCSAVIFATVTG